ncbi:DUF5696 domain-containing protein [Paenibacillus nasutitermitis]|uniref:Uncharacterized protein n=1 Tax=Paenibacillus nasutitermitis TaxID=1652958 RepID=A0A916YLX8_9BACL|nr:DUF5696 domain-containing protein [Paenibacillus nasutitermitis]GGD51203.1 hypothetical protein GCM10010911_05950 [Paenibacillus nasutitermitis]
MAAEFWNRKRVGALVKILIACGALLWFIWWIMPQGESSVVFHYDEGEFTPAAESTGGELPLGEGMKVYARDGQLELSADLGKQLFKIKDTATGVEWASGPDTAGDKSINTLTAKIVGSPFIISYTKDNSQVNTLAILSGDTKWKAFPIKGGVQIHYDLKSLGIKFIAEFALEDGALTVRIPEEGIEETKGPNMGSLVSLKILPMLGAAKQGEQGYIIVPDGSGALVDFSKPHNQATQEYSKWIYGEDPVLDPQFDPKIQEEIAIPVLGVVKQDGGYVQTVIEGAGDAKVVVSQPGIQRINYYRGGFELFLRKSYVTYYGDSWSASPINRVEAGRIGMDRAVRFDFVSGPDTTYADLARLVGDRMFGSEKSPAESKPPLIQLFQGVQSRGDSYSKRLETMTTFAEARKIMERLGQEGITAFSAEIKGWYNDGYYGRLPDRFPVEKAFGGAKGLADLLKWTASQGIETSLEDNYLDVYRKEKDGVSLRTDTVRKPDNRQYVNKPIGTTGWYRWGTSWYTLSPPVADKKVVEADLDRLKELGVQSVNLRHLGERLTSDYNADYPLRRGETQAYYEKWLELARKKLGAAGIYYGNDFAVKHADRVVGIPQYASNHYLFDEEIPLLQMIYHGRIPYYSGALNRSDDSAIEQLKAIEYGAIPVYELTYRDTTPLRYTNYDFLFSSQYETWLPSIKSAFGGWQNAVEPFGSLQMSGHERLQDGVFKTTYSDGSMVWVNYNDEMATVDGVSIKPMNYLVSKGGGA